VAAALERNSALWGYSRPLWVEPDGFIAPFAIDLGRPDDLAAFRRGNFIPSSCVLHRRSVFAAAGYWPEHVAHVADWVLWNRIIDAGGAAGVAYCAEPTALHFRADWRKSRRYDVPEVMRLAKIARRSAWWPRAFLLDLPAGGSPQATVFASLSADPEDFCATMRTAADEVYRHVSWQLVCDRPFGWVSTLVSGLKSSIARISFQ